MTDIHLLQLGETVTEGTITQWFARIGDPIVEGHPLYEVSTEKVDTEVPATVSGTLVEIVAPEGSTVQVGGVLCRIEPAGVGSASSSTVAPESNVSEIPQKSVDNDPAEATFADSAEGPSVTRSAGGTSENQRSGGLLISPVVRRLLAERGVDPARVTGTGKAGRITRTDAEQFLRDNPGQAEPFNKIRRATARHMVSSKATSPHVLTAMEVDYTAVDKVRLLHRDDWKAAEGASLTHLPFIVSALCDALAVFPRLNASVGDEELIVHGTVNLAVAVDLDFDGLVAPVVQGVEELSIQDLARSIAGVATRAHSRTLSLDDLTGGTFTVTNPGRYGTLFQFPIINQPQVAILSTDGIARRPVAIVDEHGNEIVAIRSTGVLALAWDHRAFDGAYAAAFLQSLKETLEEADWSARWSAGTASVGNQG